MRTFDFLRAYCSPFKPPIPKLYIGKVAVGVPYFFPRIWIKNPDKPGYLKAIPKKIGFDFVGLGWKTKYDDYRFEWSPVWSFVFFKWQIAIKFIAPEMHNYWECWLYYTRETKGTTKERLAQARKGFPCIWKTYREGIESKICYWDVILKKKWL